ncbi:hypothetical protein GQ44DRAFT_770300 [Phaeosphaeriaceae sp. PMI808]|nr:hypothetical protein GQ44DRAFT_770300 [Phaeosphaeriaceae sp. PMI808]
MLVKQNDVNYWEKTKYDSWNYKGTGELAEIKKGKVDEEDKFTEEELREAVFSGESAGSEKIASSIRA